MSTHLVRRLAGAVAVCALAVCFTATAAQSAPPAPTSVVAAQSTNSTNVLVSWLPPANTTKMLVGAYFAAGGFASSAWCSGTCSSLVMGGLTPGTSYVFVVWSQNSSGTSAGVSSGPVTIQSQPTAAPASVIVDDLHPLGAVTRSDFGANYPIWSQSQDINQSTRQPWPSVVSATSRIGLQFMRMDPAVNLQHCVNSDCTYHWMAATPGAPGFNTNVHQAQLSPDEWMQHVGALGGPSAVPMVQVNVEAGSTSEAQDWVAYMNGDPASSLALADGTTVGQWAQLRATNGHPAAYGLHYWEMGNEEKGLHVCAAGTVATHCVDQPPPACTTYSNQQLYGCIINAYGTLMKAVDPTIAIVAAYDGSDYTQVRTQAPTMIDAFDLHEYTVAPIDPYGTTFDTDGQSADYPVSDTTTASQPSVTFGLWIGAPSSAHVDVYLDHGATPTASVAVAVTDDNPYAITQTETAPGTYNHTLTVVACDAASVTPATNTCSDAGRHTHVYLRHLTVTPGSSSAGQLAGNTSCFTALPGLVDTRVATTTGATGTATNPGVPWRLGTNTDFPVAFATGAANIFGSGPPGQWGTLQYWRNQLNASGFTSTPLIIGEYGGWGQCRQQPPNLSVSQASALWSAQISQEIYADQNTTMPIIGAAQYTFIGGSAPACQSWNIVTTVRTSNALCIGSDTAYDGALGLALQQFAGLSGSRVNTTVAGGPAVTSLPAYSQVGMYAPGVTAVSSQSGRTITVVLVNGCPPSATSQCGDGSVPIQVNLTSATPAQSTTATTVSQLPLDTNSDAAPTTIAPAQLTPTITNGAVAVTLPPFSVTALTINT